MRMEPAYRQRMAAIGLGLAAFLIFHLLSAYPDLTERFYARGPGHLLPLILSRITGFVPVSLTEAVILVFLLRQIVGAARGLLGVRRRLWSARRAVTAGTLRLGSDIGLVVALFYVLWGFHYARAPFDQRMSWKGDGAGVAELKRLATTMVDSTNEKYMAIHGSEDAGTPTARVLKREALLKVLKAGWAESGTVVKRPGVFFGFGDPKPLQASQLLDQLGISGFYFPWTGEANYNRGIPAMSLPHVIAHEMSHQRGHAREDEANFMGYLVASRAPHPYPRYSAYAFAQRQMILALARQDEEAALALVERRLPGVQRDIDAARQYWEQFEGPVSRAAMATNNAYLKSQRVPGGIRNYSRSVELIIAYARSRGGSLE